MTTVIKQHTNDNCYISLSIETRYGNNIYIVQVCPCFDDNRCGYPIRKKTYPINEKEKAYATYRRYVKKYY